MTGVLVRKGCLITEADAHGEGADYRGWPPPPDICTELASESITGAGAWPSPPVTLRIAGASRGTGKDRVCRERTEINVSSKRN